MLIKFTKELKNNTKKLYFPHQSYIILMNYFKSIANFCRIIYTVTE